jgi:serine/threonine protein phosphatase PrpC
MLQSNQIVLAVGDKGQDRIDVLHDGNRLILVVADGAGGRSGGTEAAELVIQLARESVSALLSPKDCEQLLVEIDGAVSTDKIAGETTAVIVVVGPNNIFGASVGDSGAWILNDGRIDELSQAQIRKPFVGTGGSIPVGFSRGKLTGTLLVATDGLLKYTSRETIALTVEKSNLNELPEALVKLVRYASGNLPDDIAIGVCRPH